MKHFTSKLRSGWGREKGSHLLKFEKLFGVHNSIVVFSTSCNIQVEEAEHVEQFGARSDQHWRGQTEGKSFAKL